MAEYHELLERAYNLKSKAEAESVYDDWAANYDADLGALDYVAPVVAADRLVELAGDPGAVLDAGCGTGLVGAALAERSVSVIDGVDLSRGMLERAGARGIYRNLTRADLTRRLDIADDSYAALVCVGTLSSGHVGPEALDEFVRVVRPGGLIVVTVRADFWETLGYRARAEHLVDRGVAHLRESSEQDSIRAENITCRLAVLEASDPRGL